jgi:hypothetical protein
MDDGGDPGFSGSPMDEPAIGQQLGNEARNVVGSGVIVPRRASLMLLRKETRIGCTKPAPNAGSVTRVISLARSATRRR